MLLLNNNFMKTNILLKRLIDILFIFHCAGLIGFIFILPFGVFSINIAEVPITTSLVLGRHRLEFSILYNLSTWTILLKKNSEACTK